MFNRLITILASSIYLFPAFSYASSCTDFINHAQARLSTKNQVANSQWLTITRVTKNLGKAKQTKMASGLVEYKWVCAGNEAVYLSLFTNAEGMISKAEGQYSNMDGAGLFSADLLTTDSSISEAPTPAPEPTAALAPTAAPKPTAAPASAEKTPPATPEASQQPIVENNGTTPSARENEKSELSKKPVEIAENKNSAADAANDAKVVEAYNTFFKTAFTNKEEVSKDNFTKVQKYFSAVRNCTRGVFEYFTFMGPNYASILATIEGKEGSSCIVRIMLTTNDGKQNQLCKFTTESLAAFTDEEAKNLATGTFTYKSSEPSPLQKAQMTECQIAK